MAYRTKEEMDEEIRLCKSLDIADVAKYMGYSTYRKGNSTAYTFVKEREGLVLFNNTHTFKDFYNNISGTVIDFVMNEKNLSFKDSVSFLLQYSGLDRNKSNEIKTFTENDTTQEKPQVPEKKESELVLPEKNSDYRRVYAYLTKSRYIDYDTVNQFVKAGLIYEEKEHHNAVFVAKDKNGVPRHAFLRGTLTDPQKRFRGDVSGSDKRYGFTRVGSKDNTMLVVFEAPIDLMSFVSLTKDKDAHLIALGMLDIEPVYKYISEHPEVTEVTFVLDNDEPGINAASRFEEELQNNGITTKTNNVTEALIKHGVKDMNELLVKVKSSKVENHDAPVKSI